MGFYTTSGTKFGDSITEWLQDTRLLSEAGYRLYQDHQAGPITFSKFSWPKPTKGLFPLADFKILPGSLSQRMNGLLKALWRSQFIFLETLWEEYLQDLVLELRLKDASIFEPFCEQKFMANIVRDALGGDLTSIEEIKDEAAARFAAGITRQPWKDQWSQLARLQVGLSDKEATLTWFKHLDTYFEMRNCIIHRNGKVSSALNEKTDYFSKNGMTQIEIWPSHLDFYRKQFLNCVGCIETKIEAKFKKAPSASP